MKAVIITEPGMADVLQVQEVPNPRLRAGEVVLEVYATALNRADILQRQGNYPPPADAPLYPGLEAAGIVTEVAEGVTGWRVGDRAMALLSGGGYAERVPVPQAMLLPVPPSLSWAQAAAIPEAWLTAYSNMIEIGRLAAGESVLIHAGGSGVGSAAVQLAKWWGATVYTTASQDKVAAVQALGADEVIDYRATSFADRVLELTQGRGVNLIVDFIGAPYWDDNLRALALWGRLVLVGLMGGRQTEVNLGLFLSKKLSVHGSTLRDRTLEQKGRLVAAFRHNILPAFEEGELRPVLDRRSFPLNEVAAAHRYMEANQNFGKVILHVRTKE